MDKFKVLRLEPTISLRSGKFFRSLFGKLKEVNDENFETGSSEICALGIEMDVILSGL